MFKFLLPLVLLIAFGGASHAQRPPRPVLVELFTSEGCSSCPPADALLAKLQREQPIAGAAIIPLSIHVDYWDHQGWKDPFGSKAFTARQQAYSRIFGEDKLYTPQMVVDGREALVGSDEAAVRRAIETALQRPGLPMRLDARASAGGLRLSIDLPAAPADAEPIDVMVAVAEDDLTSAVRRGENSGRTLTHVAVVRKLETLGTLDRESFVANWQMVLERAWKAGKLRAVAWLQGRKSKHVYGSAAAAVTP